MASINNMAITLCHAQAIMFWPENTFAFKVQTSALQQRQCTILDWKIQKFYNHNFTLPFVLNIILVWWSINELVFLLGRQCGWEGFTWISTAVKKCFDPDLYKDYVGRLATLQQTTSVEAYQTAYESCLLEDVTCWRFYHNLLVYRKIEGAHQIGTLDPTN